MWDETPVIVLFAQRHPNACLKKNMFFECFLENCVQWSFSDAPSKCPLVPFPNPASLHRSHVLRPQNLAGCSRSALFLQDPTMGGAKPCNSSKCQQTHEQTGSKDCMLQISTMIHERINSVEAPPQSMICSNTFTTKVHQCLRQPLPPCPGSRLPCPFPCPCRPRTLRHHPG